MTSSMLAPWFGIAIAVGLSSNAAQPKLVVAPNGQFPRIQAAIDAATPGQTVEIRSGTYPENVTVNKQLTLRGVDSGAGLPIVDAQKSGSAVTLAADGVTLHGLVAVNSGRQWGDAGILVQSNHNTLHNNIARNNKAGVIVRRSDHNTLESNEVMKNDNGILLEGASDSVVRKNTVRQNRSNGILIAPFHRNKQSQFALRNKVVDNVVHANRDGITIGHMAHQNTIARNQVTDHRDNGVIVNCGPSKNIILLNRIQNSQKYGVLFTSAGFGNMVVANQVTDNGSGMGILSSFWNGFTRNRIADNRTYGILMSDMGVLMSAAARNIPGASAMAGMHPTSSHNVIWENDLSNNQTNAYDTGGKPWRMPAMMPSGNRETAERKMNEAMTPNRWDKDGRGNHYSDFDEPAEGCVDADHNGISDRAHPIPGGQCVDHFPLVAPPDTATAPDPLPSILPPTAEIPGLLQGALPGMMPPGMIVPPPQQKSTKSSRSSR